MKVVIRTDASHEIGSGHVMRCLVIADAFAVCGAHVIFICYPHTGNQIDRILAHGHEVRILASDEVNNGLYLGNSRDSTKKSDHVLAQIAHSIIQSIGGADLLIVDHYDLDYSFEKLMRPAVGRIVVIDDLANRLHDCDVLLDQNLGRKHSDYDYLVPANALLCIGPHWAILRPDFLKYRHFSLTQKKPAKLHNVLVSMGGTDVGGLTIRSLNALADYGLGSDVKIRVILGNLVLNCESLIKNIHNMPLSVEVLSDISNMAEEMSHADLGIGAGGTASWERCCLGLAAIVSPIADNQRSIIQTLTEAGAVRAIIPDERYEISLASEFGKLKENPELISQMSMNAAKLCDGKGTERFLSILTKS